MSRFQRVLAACGALAIVVVAFPATSPAADPASNAAAAAAVAWLKTQQEADGGFEVADFPGFETRDASLAIAEQAQTGSSWSTGQALAALAALHYGGSGPTPLDALDEYAATITTAGGAAKTIVLSASPLGLDPAAFDPGDDGAPVDLVALLDAGCGANTASFGGAFSDTLYAILAKHLVCGAAPPAAIATVRAAQQANGGWNFVGDSSGTDLDIDTTSLAIESLVADGASASDPAVHNALVFLADNVQATGAWQSFGADDPNSTALGAIAVTAAGYDVDSPCWRDTFAPGKASIAFVSPTAWIRSQQQSDGRVASPNDGFGVNTFATAQAVQGLLRSWLPIERGTAQTCTVTPPVVPPPTVSTPAPSAGSAMTISGDGFMPNTQLTIELHSDPIVLATTTTDATGAYSVVVVIPAGTIPGAHQIVVAGLGPTGQPQTSVIDITVEAAEVVIAPAFTG